MAALSNVTWSGRLSDDSFDAVSSLFKDVAGIELGPAKRDLVESRLRRLFGNQDLNAQVRMLVRQRSEPLLSSVVDVLVTNETSFFREPQHFEFLAKWLAAQAPHSELRLWCAACSSGEEAYSAAMVLASQARGLRWSILATDLSQRMLVRAQRGVYSQAQIRSVPPTYADRFCWPGVDDCAGAVLIDPALRRHIRFQQLNLNRPLPDSGSFQLIFLRNVLIYFDNAARRAMVQRIINRLAPGGVLLSGHAESLGNLGLPLRLNAPAIYEKI